MEETFNLTTLHRNDILDIRHLGTKKLCGLFSFNRHRYLHVEVSLNLKKYRTPTALSLSRFQSRYQLPPLYFLFTYDQQYSFCSVYEVYTSQFHDTAVQRYQQSYCPVYRACIAVDTFSDTNYLKQSFIFITPISTYMYEHFTMLIFIVHINKSYFFANIWYLYFMMTEF